MRQFDTSSRQAVALVVLLLLGATFLRVYDLANTPPGEAFDATWNLADALRISRGIPFPAAFDTRPEPAYRFLLAGWFALLGPHRFTARLLQALVGVLTVALTYRAGLALLAGQSWRRSGALIAAGALAAMMPHLFLSRASYRAALLPLVILAALLLFLRAVRTRRAWMWAAGGFLAGCGLHTYLAGILTPLWGASLVGSQVILPQRRERLCWREALFVVLGLALPILAWLALAWAVPDLFFRVGAAGDVGAGPLPDRLLVGFWGAVRAFFLEGYPLPLYNTPHTPFLNPALALLAVLGTALALRRWRHADGASLLLGLVLFIFPAALSQNPTHPVRLVGTMPFLALLAGWGAAWGLNWLSSRRAARSFPPDAAARHLLLQAAVVLIVVFSLAGTHLAYHAMFNDPARYEHPEHWLSIPHNDTMALFDALTWLAEVDQPTYVPLSPLDTPLGAFLLQRDAFPNVTTWARDDLETLPDGQVFYPARGYYHAPAPEGEPLQALLLPDEGTIVILPGAAVDLPDEAAPVTNERGWVIGRVAPVRGGPFALPELSPVEDAPLVGDGLYLLNQDAALALQPGASFNAVLFWGVTAPQPADVFTFAQVLDLDLAPWASSDHHVLPYLYPSARWQPGDVIPDLHTLSLPAEMADGPYRWAAGAYVPPGQHRLPVTAPPGRANPLGDAWLWGALRLPAPGRDSLPADATPLDVRLGGRIALQGYTLARDGPAWTLTLYWCALAVPQDDFTIFVHLMSGGEIIAQRDERPRDGRLPTWAWWPGELVTTTHPLNLPAEAPPPDALYVGLYRYPSLDRLSVVQDGAPRDDGRALIWAVASPAGNAP